MGHTRACLLTDCLDLQFDLEPHREAVEVMMSCGFGRTHFPGRYLTGAQESSSLKGDAEAFVYVALFEPST